MNNISKLGWNCITYRDREILPVFVVITQFLLIGTIGIRAVSLSRTLPYVVLLLIEIVCPVLIDVLRNSEHLNLNSSFSGTGIRVTYSCIEKIVVMIQLNEHILFHFLILCF